jgi:hypothetical protein
MLGTCVCIWASVCVPVCCNDSIDAVQLPNTATRPTLLATTSEAGQSLTLSFLSGSAVAAGVDNNKKKKGIVWADSVDEEQTRREDRVKVLRKVTPITCNAFVIFISDLLHTPSHAYTLAQLLSHCGGISRPLFCLLLCLFHVLSRAQVAFKLAAEAYRLAEEGEGEEEGDE